MERSKDIALQNQERNLAYAIGASAARVLEQSREMQSTDPARIIALAPEDVPAKQLEAFCLGYISVAFKDLEEIA